MAKTIGNSGSSTVLEESADEFYRPQASPAAGQKLPRAPRVEAQEEAEEPFLRTRRRVPVRRGILPLWSRTRWGKVVLLLAGLAIVAACVASVLAVRHFLYHDARFRIDSPASIETVGNNQLSRADLLSVFGSDLGRNIFMVPLARRRAELEQLPWVESATVMRVLPGQLRIAVKERTPIAFVEMNGRIELVDAAGVILTMAPQQMAARHYSFPVVTGINPGDPLSVRAARMHLYQRFLHDVDAGGEDVGSQLSEIDLSDPEDVRATVPSQGTDLLLDFGMQDFLARWRNYQTHVAEWRSQYPKLAAVDLRYDNQVVLKMAGDAGTQGDSGAGTTEAQTAKPRKAAVKHRVHAHAVRSRHAHRRRA